MKVSTKQMTTKQLQVYGARIRLAWFRKAEELGQVRDACAYFGIARSEYYYWHKRWAESGKKLISLYDLSRTPHSSPKQLDEDIISLIVAVRIDTGYGERTLEKVLARDYDCVVSHHGIGNVLKRAALTRRVTRKARQRQLDSYEYAPGERGQMDVKHWKRTAYQYDIIDCATRIKYKRLYYGVSPAHTVDFLDHARRFFAPAFEFQEIQTDNGMEFTFTQMPQVRKKHPVDVYLESCGITHRFIRASSPNLNGRIERSHGTDKAGFRYAGHDYTVANLQAFLTEDCVRYNTYRPHHALGMMTPLEYLQSLPGYENATVDLSVLNV
jgi:transposase InsO family protein